MTLKNEKYLESNRFDFEKIGGRKVRKGQDTQYHPQVGHGSRTCTNCYSTVQVEKWREHYFPIVFKEFLLEGKEKKFKKGDSLEKRNEGREM